MGKLAKQINPQRGEVSFEYEGVSLVLVANHENLAKIEQVFGYAGIMTIMQRAMGNQISMTDMGNILLNGCDKVEDEEDAKAVVFGMGYTDMQVPIFEYIDMLMNGGKPLKKFMTGTQPQEPETAKAIAAS